MYMTQEADNAVRIVFCLAEGGRRRDARFIAERTGVSLRFALKILGKLAANDIVKSYKGQGGGYELTKAPEKITLNDVIETVDGPYALNKCLHGNHECTMDDSEACCFREVYADISRTITQKLEAVSFAQLLMKK
ncbi:MAG: Rrf2 family transcriptional regulator [Oscillospiraceae bacterium]